MTIISPSSINISALSATRRSKPPTFVAEPAVIIEGRDAAIDPGLATGDPTPLLSWQLQVDGIDVTSAASELRWTCPDTAAHAIVLVVTASNGAGVDATATASAAMPAAHTAPAPFADDEWLLSDMPSDMGDTARLEVLGLPHDGGSPIIALEYQVDDGTGFTAPQPIIAVGPGTQTITLPPGLTATVAVRAVNGIGPGAWSAAKTVTPTALPDFTLLEDIGDILARSYAPGTWSATGAVVTTGITVRGAQTATVATTATWNRAAVVDSRPMMAGMRCLLSFIVKNDSGGKARIMWRDEATSAQSNYDFDLVTGAGTIQSAVNGSATLSSVDLGGGWWQVEALVTALTSNAHDAAIGTGLGTAASILVAGGGVAQLQTVPMAFAAGDWALAALQSVGGDQIDLSLVALPYDGGSPITAVEYRVGAGAWTTLSGGSVLGSRTLQVPAGVEATVEVRALNTIGAGPASAAKKATPLSFDVPAKMAAPALAGGVEDATITLAADPADGGSPITAREWQVDLAGGDFSGQVVTGTTSPATIDPLAAGSYIARSRASNVMGAGAWSDASAATTVLAAIVPLAEAAVPNTLAELIAGRLAMGASLNLDIKSCVTGGVAPYSFAISGLPAGLVDDGDGTISGTPSEATIGTLSVIVTDARGSRTTINAPYTILAAFELFSGPESQFTTNGLSPISWAQAGGTRTADALVRGANTVRFDTTVTWHRLEVTGMTSPVVGTTYRAAFIVKNVSGNQARIVVRDPVVGGTDTHFTFDLSTGIGSLTNTPSPPRPSYGIKSTDLGDGWWLLDVGYGTLTANTHIVGISTGLATPASILVAGGGVAEEAGVAVSEDYEVFETYTTRDPLYLPFAPDSIWNTPLSADATIVATAAFSDVISTLGDKIRVGQEDNAIVVALGPVADPPSLTGVDAADLAAARAGHPESPSVSEVAVYGNGDNLGQGWEQRLVQKNGARWLDPAVSLATLGLPASYARSGLPLPAAWYKLDKPWLDYSPAEQAELIVTYNGVNKTANDLNALSPAGNACLAVISENHIAGSGPVVSMFLGAARAPGGNLYVYSGGTSVTVAPNIYGALPFASARYKGFVSLHAGLGNEELFPGAAAEGLVPPTRARLNEVLVSNPAVLGRASYMDPSRLGQHGGAQGSNLGGTIRVDELCAAGTAVDTIRHVIGLNVSSMFLANRADKLTNSQGTADEGAAYAMNPWAVTAQAVPNRWDSLAKVYATNEINGFGRVWPAANRDNTSWPGSPDVQRLYTGTDPNVTMGSLLVLPSASLHPVGVDPFDIETLQTLPAKRIAWALQHYGGIPIDIVPEERVSTAQQSFLFCVEERYRPAGATVSERHYAMALKFYERFGHNMRVQSSTANAFPADADYGGKAGAAQQAWRTDIRTILQAMCVVTNNWPHTPGGGTGNRIVAEPVAPVSLLGGYFLLGSVPQVFGNLRLYRRAGAADVEITGTVFGTGFVNAATGTDLAEGVAIFHDLDRGWYRVAQATTGETTPWIFLELGQQRLGTWTLA